MEKKKLEQLFKDRFKDFQEIPDERVWESIEASLDQKRKRRVVPIWWQTGGVAALLAILLYIINPFGNKLSIDATTVTDTEQIEAEDTNNKQINPQDAIDASNPFPDTDALTGVDVAVDSEKQEKISENERQRSDKSTRTTFESPHIQQQNNQIASSNNNTKNAAIKEEKNVLGTKKIEENQNVIAKTTDRENQNLNQVEGNVIAANDDKATEKVSAESPSENSKKSIFEVIEEQAKENTIAKKSENKWSVGPAVAPVFFNGIGEGSPVHSSFNANSKSGNINFSYGLNIAYELNKKLSVRTGVHRVNFGYDTNEIVFSSSLNSSNNQDLNNINFNQSSDGLVIESAANATQAANANADFIARSPEFEGRMVQQLGYMEVPVEVNYTLVDKKFGVNLIGGMSSLFLVDNSISLESNGLITELGDANNVNDVNFSTNVGLGLNYKFTNTIQANVEPVFKYQLNTFSNTAGDFRPFSFGVYSGLNFKF